MEWLDSVVVAASSFAADSAVVVVIDIEIGLMLVMI